MGDALTALDGATNQSTQNIADNKAAIINITEGINNGTVGLVQQNPSSRNIG
ncbi:hypothetical protein QE177_14570 (plasmid) [Arsenophonus sp. aPb]|uniref:hypothetical protein n=1 Tax=Arsenophonus sp. aPb TaxID=3041619 RepID=UPI002469127D|nr:hypothetical protein [Arsenophonus sp. aPb]WGL99805.1 hypothetical protein QE177_14570 [Arsenophonus sp. aPb]